MSHQDGLRHAMRVERVRDVPHDGGHGPGGDLGRATVAGEVDGEDAMPGGEESGGGVPVGERP
jgi:hypothetical protein